MIYCTVEVMPRSIALVCGIANIAAAWHIPATITAARNGTHMGGSLHYVDAAIDIRTHGLTKETISIFLHELRIKFPTPIYDVLFESEGTPNEHIHVEDNRAKAKV